MGLGPTPYESSLDLASVYDQSRRPPVLRRSDGDAGSGRGLALVAALSERWGRSYPTSVSGKWVHASLLIPVVAPVGRRIPSPVLPVGEHPHDVQRKLRCPIATR
jgi:hypothetical protein